MCQLSRSASHCLCKIGRLYQDPRAIPLSTCLPQMTLNMPRAYSAVLGLGHARGCGSSSNAVVQLLPCCHSVGLALAGHSHDIPRPTTTHIHKQPSILYSVFFISLGCLLYCQRPVDHGDVPRRCKWPRLPVLGFKPPNGFGDHHERPLCVGGWRCANRRPL
jgi:hypothetical protein